MLYIYFHYYLNGYDILFILYYLSILTDDDMLLWPRTEYSTQILRPTRESNSKNQLEFIVIHRRTCIVHQPPSFLACFWHDVALQNHRLPGAARNAGLPSYPFAQTAHAGFSHSLQIFEARSTIIR